MGTAEELRQKADNCAELAESTNNDPKKTRFKRMESAWNSLAETQAWLDGEPQGDTRSRRDD